MEFKKYMLLDNKVIINVSKTTQIEYSCGVVRVKYEEYIDDVQYKTWRTRVEKLSDNILDLVEVGDLVETKQSIMDVVEVIKEDEEFIFYLSHDVVFDNNIIAIYKKQSNSDYKRYAITD